MTPPPRRRASASARRWTGTSSSKTLTEIALAGQQAKIPLLAGSNTEEQGAAASWAAGEPTPETLASAIRKFYGDKAEPVVKAYAATTTEDVSKRLRIWPVPASFPTARGNGPSCT